MSSGFNLPQPIQQEQNNLKRTPAVSRLAPVIVPNSNTLSPPTNKLVNLGDNNDANNLKTFFDNRSKDPKKYYRNTNSVAQANASFKDYTTGVNVGNESNDNKNNFKIKLIPDNKNSVNEEYVVINPSKRDKTVTSEHSNASFKDITNRVNVSNRSNDNKNAKFKIKLIPDNNKVNDEYVVINPSKRDKIATTEHSVDENANQIQTHTENSYQSTITNKQNKRKQNVNARFQKPKNLNPTSNQLKENMELSFPNCNSPIQLSQNESNVGHAFVQSPHQSITLNYNPATGSYQRQNQQTTLNEFQAKKPGVLKLNIQTNENNKDEDKKVLKITPVQPVQNNFSDKQRLMPVSSPQPLVEDNMNIVLSQNSLPSNVYQRSVSNYQQPLFNENDVNKNNFVIVKSNSNSPSIYYNDLLPSQKIQSVTNINQGDMKSHLGSYTNQGVTINQQINKDVGNLQSPNNVKQDVQINTVLPDASKTVGLNSEVLNNGNRITPQNYFLYNNAADIQNNAIHNKPQGYAQTSQAVNTNDNTFIKTNQIRNNQSQVNTHVCDALNKPKQASLQFCPICKEKENFCSSYQYNHPIENNVRVQINYPTNNINSNPISSPNHKVYLYNTQTINKEANQRNGPQNRASVQSNLIPIKNSATLPNNNIPISSKSNVDHNSFTNEAVSITQNLQTDKRSNSGVQNTDRNNHVFTNFNSVSVQNIDDSNKIDNKDNAINAQLLEYIPPNQIINKNQNYDQNNQIISNINQAFVQAYGGLSNVNQVSSQIYQQSNENNLQTNKITKNEPKSKVELKNQPNSVNINDIENIGIKESYARSQTCNSGFNDLNKVQKLTNNKAPITLKIHKFLNPENIGLCLNNDNKFISNNQETSYNSIYTSSPSLQIQNNNLDLSQNIPLINTASGSENLGKLNNLQYPNLFNIETPPISNTQLLLNDKNIISNNKGNSYNINYASTSTHQTQNDNVDLSQNIHLINTATGIENLENFNKLQYPNLFNIETPPKSNTQVLINENNIISNNPGNSYNVNYASTSSHQSQNDNVDLLQKIKLVNTASGTENLGNLNNLQYPNLFTIESPATYNTQALTSVSALNTPPVNTVNQFPSSSNIQSQPQTTVGYASSFPVSSLTTPSVSNVYTNNPVYTGQEATIYTLPTYTYNPPVATSLQYPSAAITSPCVKADFISQLYPTTSNIPTITNAPSISYTPAPVIVPYTYPQQIQIPHIVPISCAAPIQPSSTLDGYSKLVSNLVEPLLSAFDPKLLLESVLYDKLTNSESPSLIDLESKAPSISEQSEMKNAPKYKKALPPVPNIDVPLLDIVQNLPVNTESIGSPLVYFSLPEFSLATTNMDAPETVCHSLPFPPYSPPLSSLIIDNSSSDSSSTAEFMKWVLLTQLFNNNNNLDPLLALLFAYL